MYYASVHTEHTVKLRDIGCQEAQVRRPQAISVRFIEEELECDVAGMSPDNLKSA